MNLDRVWVNYVETIQTISSHRYVIRHMIVIITDQGFQVILSGDTPSVQQSQIISDKPDEKYYQH